MGGHGALIAALKNPGKYKVFQKLCFAGKCVWYFKNLVFMMGHELRL